MRKVTTKVKESYDAATKKIHALFTTFQFVGFTALSTKLQDAHSGVDDGITMINDSEQCEQQRSSVFTTAWNVYHRLNSHFDCTFNVFSTFAFASSKNNDTYTFKKMMRQDDKGKFMEAMVKEVDDHIE